MIHALISRVQLSVCSVVTLGVSVSTIAISGSSICLLSLALPFQYSIQISKGGAAEATGKLKLGDRIFEVHTALATYAYRKLATQTIPPRAMSVSDSLDLCVGRGACRPCLHLHL